MNIIRQPFQLYFSGKRIIVVIAQLSKSNRVQVKSALAGNIENLVKDRQITYVDKASDIVKTLIQKSGDFLKKRDIVDICLPDSYFLTKILSIPPDVEKNKQAEYVQSRVEEVFPLATKEVYVRWKQIDSSIDKVMMAAIARKYLNPVLDICDRHKLIVRSVKPLSFVAARLVNKLGKDHFILQILNEGEVTTAVCLGQEVLFSSCSTIKPTLPLIDLVSQELDKARKFILPFGPEKVTSLWSLGFDKNTQIMMTKLMTPGTKLNRLEDKVVVNGNLDPLSLSVLIGLAGFGAVKTTSLNFAPLRYQKRYTREIFLRQTSSNLFIFCLSMLIPLTILSYFMLNLWFSFRIKNTSLASARNSVITSGEQKIEKEAVEINKKVQVLTGLYNQKTQTNQLLAKFGQTIPAGINVTSVELNQEGKKLRLKGIAFSRQDLLEFNRNLKELGTVSIPITSYVKFKDLPFDISVTLP
jgi:Tfp pilus assembly protein PilN